jgi:hypothetical protein
MRLVLIPVLLMIVVRVVVREERREPFTSFLGSFPLALAAPPKSRDAYQYTFLL